MEHLECLKLDIINRECFSYDDILHPYDEICNQINKLEKLRHLKLAFNSQKKVPKERQLSNFLPQIYPVLKKPIKLEALSLSCNQIDQSEAFPDLISALQDLHSSLRKLKIDLGVPSCNQKLHQTVSDLVKELCNLKVLKLPSLAINANQSLSFIMEAVLELKNLEVLIMGEIRSKVEVTLFLKTMRILLCKRGFRKFHCEIAQSLQKKIFAEIPNSKEHNNDMRKFIKGNPSLENVLFSPWDSESRLTSEILKWHEIERGYGDICSPY